MKKILIAALAVLMLIASVACSSAPAYSDGVAVEQLTADAIGAIGSTEDYIDGTSNYFAYYFEGKEGAEHIGECRMMFHKQETNVSELGVFRVDSAKATDKVKTLVQSYLAEQQDYLRGFAKNYSPEDMNKIDNAAVTVKGCYVIYYILSPEDEAKALDAIEDALSVK